MGIEPGPRGDWEESRRTCPSPTYKIIIIIATLNFHHYITFSTIISRKTELNLQLISLFVCYNNPFINITISPHCLIAKISVAETGKGTGGSDSDPKKF